MFNYYFGNIIIGAGAALKFAVPPLKTIVLISRIKNLNFISDSDFDSGYGFSTLL